jgi:hypothetical protein
MAEGPEKDVGPRHACPLCGVPMKKTKGGEYNSKCLSCGYEVACCD